MSILSHAAFQTDLQELLSLNGKLHGQLVYHLFYVAIYNKANGIFGGDAPLIAIKYLILSNLRGGGLVFHFGGIVVNLEIGEGMCPTFIAQQQ
jgi:hypothetical protein